MAFKFSLGGVKANKSQLGSKARAEEEAKERAEKNALDKVMAEFEEEHGGGKSVLGDMEEDVKPEDEVFVPTGNKRHFTGRARSTMAGPGTLGVDPLDEFRAVAMPGRSQDQSHSRFGGHSHRGPAAFENAKPKENVYTTVIAKASNLPPDVDPKRIELLFAEFPTLKVAKVEKIPPDGPKQGRQSASMKVIFEKNVTARDLDLAMIKLNDKKYLGQGYYLHLDRYLGGRVADTVKHQEAFGARWQAPEVPKGFAPPPDLGGSNRDRPREDTEHLIVTVNQPPDMASLRLIHQTIEGVIEGGIEFEAALMNDSMVKEEERFAWLYDQSHPLNRYYRWKMHDIICDIRDPEIFEDAGTWSGPKEVLADEFVDSLGVFGPYLEDSDSDEEPAQFQYKALPVGDDYPGRDNKGYGMLNPRSRTLLIWLLTSLPPSSLVADDVAAVSAFAVDHTTQGMDEIIDILISNIFEPFSLSNPSSRARGKDAEGKEEVRRSDVKQVTLNALHVLSDVLFTTSKESGAVYKYRAAIGSALVSRKVFEYLDHLPVNLELGRMTAKSFRDEIKSILAVWQEHTLFEGPLLSKLDDAFNARERQKEQEDQERKMEERRNKKAPVVQKPNTSAVSDYAPERTVSPITDQMSNSENIGQENSAIGEEMNVEREDLQTVPVSPDTKEAIKPATVLDEVPGETAAARARRLRPKAEDMFASDED